MKTYFYDFDKKSGLRLAQATLVYEDNTDCHTMRVDIGGTSVSVGVHPEELADIYNGDLCENLVYKIRRAVIDAQSLDNQSFILNELNPVIKDYVLNIAKRIGLNISKAQFTGGLEASCVDYRLEITSKSHVVNTLLNKAELEIIKGGSNSGFLEMKIRATLDRLKSIVE